MRKRNAPPALAQPPILTHPPTFDEVVTVLSRTLSYISISGTKIEWANYQGNLVLTFKGMMLETDHETGKAKIIKSSDYVTNLAYSSIKSKEAEQKLT